VPSLLALAVFVFEQQEHCNSATGNGRGPRCVWECGRRRAGTGAGAGAGACEGACVGARERADVTPVRQQRRMRGVGQGAFDAAPREWRHMRVVGHAGKRTPGASKAGMPRDGALTKRSTRADENPDINVQRYAVTGNLTKILDNGSPGLFMFRHEPALDGSHPDLISRSRNGQDESSRPSFDVLIRRDQSVPADQRAN
jgi:hypothetical protein